MDYELAETCRSLAKWARANPARGWRVRGARFEALRRLRLAGRMWLAHHCIRAGTDLFVAELDIFVSRPLRPPAERRLRERGVFTRIHRSVARLGYTGGWQIESGIGGHWRMVLDEQLTPKSEVAVFRHLDFPSGRALLRRRGRRSVYHSVKSLPESLHERLLYEVIDLPTKRPGSGHIPAFVGIEHNTKERLGGRDWCVVRAILAGGEPAGSFESCLIISTAATGRRALTARLRSIQRELRGSGFHGGRLQQSQRDLILCFDKVAPLTSSNLANARSVLDGVRMATLLRR